MEVGCTVAVGSFPAGTTAVIARWLMPAPRRLLSVPLTWSVEWGAMIGQLGKPVGEVIVTYCLQSPTPCTTKAPVPFLLDLISGHWVFPHVVVATSICVTARGTSLVFSIAKVKSPPGFEGELLSSGTNALLASAMPASTRIVTRVASAAPPWRNPS